MTQPSSGCYFLLAVVFFSSGIKAQDYYEIGNQTQVLLGNETHEYPGNEAYDNYEYPEYVKMGGLEGAPRDTIVPPLPLCHAEICVRKCCPVGEVYQIDLVNFKIGCVPKFANESEFEPQFSYRDGRPREVNLQNVEYLIGFPAELGQPECPKDGMVDTDDESALLLGDGTLFTPKQPLKLMRRSVHQYCVEQHRYIGMEKDGQLVMETQTCILEWQTSYREVYRLYAHNACFIISNSALLFLFFLHLISPKMRDLAGCTLVSYGAGIFLGYLGLLMSNISSFSAELGKSTVNCRIFAFVTHAGFLTSYFWLTVMCFDIWRYVRLTVKGIPGSHMRHRDMNMYLIYSAVVWGVVLLVEVFVITMELLPASSLPENFIKPHMAVERCFVLDEDMNLLLYWYIFLSAAFILDLFFIITTGYYLKKSGANIFFCFSKNRAFDSESAVFNAKYLDLFWQRFMIFSMTIFLWTTEVLSWKIPPEWMWEPTDLLNCLQGVIILVIFLRQKSKRTEICNIYRKWMKKPAKKSAGEYSGGTTRSTNIDSEASTKISKISVVSMGRKESDLSTVPLNQR